MATPKADRAAPPRVFENYIVTRTKDVTGVIPIIESAMTPLSGGTDLIFGGGGTGYHIGEGYSQDASSILTPIGFNFEFDGVTYTHFIATTNGWMALADPTAADPAEIHDDLLLSGTSVPYENQNIKLINSSSSALLCPWFDTMNSLSDDPLKYLGTVESEGINHGILPIDPAYNGSQWGIRVYYDTASPHGRRTVVRWNSYFNGGGPRLPIFKFDVVLYENGKIEFRYVPRSRVFPGNENTDAAEGATVGIFVSGSNRFRDFGSMLKATPERDEYIYGGAVYDANFSEIDENEGTERPYVLNLKSALHWPGFADAGAIITFQPPLNKRRVLPRNLRRQLDSTRLISNAGSFDDQRTLNFLSTGSSSGSSSGSVIVSYPSTLQRFFGGFDPGVAARQDIFAGDFLVTGSSNAVAVEQFLEPVPYKAHPEHRAFSEIGRLDQDPSASDDPFFVSGSLPSVSQPTRSKRQIRFSLPVNYTTTMLNQTSSMLYYNTRVGRWEIPSSSLEDLADPQQVAGIYQRQFFEDFKGFGAIGNPIMSGSENLFPYNASPTLGLDSRGLSIENLRRSLIKTVDPGTSAVYSDFQETVTVNPAYDANVDQTITLQIDRPFIVEKAIIEVPLECGPGWFEDRTRTFIPHTTPSTFITALEPRPDFAGPALTVALFNQIEEGQTKVRDLIMTGVITHELDMSSSLVISNFPPLSTSFQLRPEGFLAYASEPAAVVPVQDVNGTQQFTGSVFVKSEAAITNGPVILLKKNMISSTIGGYEAARAELLDLFRTETIPIKETFDSPRGAEFDIEMLIAYPNAVGRGSTDGLDPSGRSIFGKEMGTFQGSSIFSRGAINNPFYLPTGSVQTGQIQEAVDFSGFATFSEGWRARAMIPIAEHFRSPYLLLPGDKLVLAISKTRPMVYAVTASSEGGHANASPLSGTLGHDLKLLSGSVNITLYGTTLQMGEEYAHDISDRLDTESVYKVIGDEPVLDQFDVPYRGQFIGSSYDDFITGSLAVKSKNAAQQTIIQTFGDFLTGGRGRVFSGYSARLQPNPATPSKAFNLQPWWERVGSPRVNQITDRTERYWDSFMPGLSDALQANGSGIFTILSGSNSIGPSETVVTDPNLGLGIIVLDVGPFAIDQVDRTWSKSFPFEPRYSRVARQRNIEKSFTATFLANSISIGPVSQIPPKLMSGLYIGRGTQWTLAYNSYQDRIEGQGVNDPITWLSDIDLTQEPATPSLFITGSARSSEISKFMFGFGDLNGRGTGDDIDQGTNNGAEFRNYGAARSPFDVNHIYCQGVVIRGWKYGVHSGLPTYSKAYFRRDRFGQLRDMLEPRPFTRYFRLKDPTNPTVVREGLVNGPVQVRFVDAAGNTTTPENTQSSNLDLYATSSCPFFDGEFLNRPDLIQEAQNTNILQLTTNEFGITAL